MASKPDRHVLERKKGERSDSVLEARAIFLSLVLDLHPRIAENLWAKALFGFSFAVANNFKAELLADEGSTDQGSTGDPRREVFADLLIGALRKVEADGSSEFTDEKILLYTFGRFRVLTHRQLSDAFPNWASLMDSAETAIVGESVHQWSVDSNLDAEWCRDHALSVCREWLADESLRWAFLSPTMKAQMHRKGWQRALSAVDWYVRWSRIRDALIVFDDNLEPFKFQWQGRSFEVEGWDYLKYKEADWRRRTTLKFRVWLDQMELEILGPIMDKAALDEFTVTDFESQLAWRNGASTEFNKSVREYLSLLKAKKAAAKSLLDLAEVDERPKLLQHLEWAVRYQIGGESLSQIGVTVREEAGGVEPSTVSRAIDYVLDLIGLQKRLDAKRGRTLGSKNKKPPILGDLGR